MNRFADVFVALPVEGPFSYAIPGPLSKSVGLGRRVLVPFGRRIITGYVVAVSSTPGVENPKDILDVLDEAPLFDLRALKFYKWLASYYFAPLGEVLSLTHPNSINVQSSRFFRLAEGSPPMLYETGLKKDLLDSIGKGVTLKVLLKRFKSRGVHSALGALKKEGLLTEELRLGGGGRAKTEVAVCLSPGLDSRAALKAVARYPLQSKVLHWLIENSPANYTNNPAGDSPKNIINNNAPSLKELRRAIGGMDSAVKSLEGKGYVRVFDREVARDPVGEVTPRELTHEPNPEQSSAIGELAGAISRGGYAPFLLYGVTGSGKTLVYIKAVEEALAAGKRVIYLVPEIALTSRAVGYLSGRFPGRVAVVHSSLSEGERYDQWRRIVGGGAGGVDIVIGARSALFSPLKDLGLIVVDEEHETSYKQEEGVRYNARDAALMLAKRLEITVVLGSATPSIETFYNSKTGKIKPLYLTKRVRGLKLPPIELYDMKAENKDHKGKVISRGLRELVEGALEGGHQALLFLNRRGFSSFLVCRDCGHIPGCPNCSVTLTMHKGRRVLKCHYCDLETPIPSECPSCNGYEFVDPGIGTEKAEEEARGLFPNARIGRMDRDTTRRKGEAGRIIDAVEERKLDILVGTQMVAKGHHFPGITVVGVLSGDTSLNIPDFRSSERTFQLICQAGGRAGRGEAAAKVLVQTLNPGHFCFTRARSHDYEGFYEEELEGRREVNYPPFVRICSVRIEGTNEERVVRGAAELKKLADKGLEMAGGGITVLGPAPALLAKLKGRYRWQLLVKGADVGRLNGFLTRLKRGFKLSGVTVTMDMDPVSTI